MTGSNPFAGQPLYNQSANALAQGFGGYNTMGQVGARQIGQGMGYAGQAGNTYGSMAGAMPQNVRAGQLSRTNFDPYMNQYTKNVINTTMNELNRQEQNQANLMAGQAQQQGAFGGDRFAIQQAENNRNYDAQRASTIAQLNQANFGNAQQMAQQDITGRYNASLANQGLAANQQATGAQGLSGLGQGLQQQGAGNLANASSGLMGGSQQAFNTGQAIMGAQSAAGQTAQNLQQNLINAAKGQWGGYSSAPVSGLQMLLQGNSTIPGGIGTTTSSSSQSKGAGQALGGGLSAIGQIGGMLK